MLLYCAFCGVVIITCGLFGFLVVVVTLFVGVGFGVFKWFPWGLLFDVSFVLLDV